MINVISIFYNDLAKGPGPIFSYKLRYIVGFRLVEMAISTNPEPTIYHNLYENTGPGFHLTLCWKIIHFALKYMLTVSLGEIGSYQH